MPKLNNWFITSGVAHNWRESPTPFTAPELITQHLAGEISEDDRFESGSHVTTSTVVAKHGDKVITRSGTEYELLDVARSYEKEFPNAKGRLLNNLPERPRADNHGKAA